MHFPLQHAFASPLSVLAAMRHRTPPFVRTGRAKPAPDARAAALLRQAARRAFSALY